MTTPPAAGDQSFDPTRSRRIAADSTATSDIFHNPDGSYTRRVYAGPHNFRAGNGSWTPIDTTVAKGSDGRWRENANAFGVDFAGSADDGSLVSVSLDGSHAVAYGLAGAAGVAPTVAGSTVSYPGVLAGTDLSLTTTATGVKESLVLRSAAVATSWVFPLRLQGLSGRLESDGSVSFVDGAGVVRATVPPGSMSDSKVDPGTGQPATSQGVSYQLITVAGGPALRMSVDATWLADPARVFPVTVDPTVNTTASASTFADSTVPGDNSGSALVNVGTRNGTEKAYSFLQFPSFGTTYGGASISGVWLQLRDVWAASCSATAFGVSPVTTPWTPSGVTAYPGPLFGSSIGSLTASPGGACSNTSLNPANGVTMVVPLTTATFQSWASGGANYGLAVTASQSDTTAWKQFASSTTGQWAPFLQVSYTGNVLPVVDKQYPPNNATVTTLRPVLLASGHDPDSATTVNYFFTLYDGTTAAQLAASGWVASGAWQVPAGLLRWGKPYLWTAQSGDGTAASAYPPVFAFWVGVPQPALTSHLTQNSDANGVDASIGNYTTSATDATVLTAGPPLSVKRDYNSKDRRVGGAFGAGWSSVLDARAVEQADSGNALQSVVVTYPEGQEVGFGANADGTFSPPQGRYATFATVTGGGYTLTDKNQTVYRFARVLNAGCASPTCRYGITSITDANGRAITFGYTGAQVTAMTSGLSGRVLHITWATPPGATAAHVATVYTDPAVTGDSTTAQTWTYSYTNDQLSTVCPPTSSTACTSYGYAAGTQHPTTVLDLGAHSYWRLGEAPGTTTATSSVLMNQGSDNATYGNVALGQPGPLAGSTATAAGFNGTSSYVDLTGGAVSKAVVTNSSYQSISMWFKTTTGNSVLFSYQADPISNASTTGNYTPALYIGSDGRLQGLLWCGGCAAPIASGGSVADGNWHHVVLAGGGNTQSLYLDGALLATRPGVIQLFNGNGAQNSYIGAGFLGGQWPDQSHYSTSNSTGYPAYFAGSIADVAFFDKWLTQDGVTALYTSGHAAAQLLTSHTRPSGNTAAGVSYDAVSGRVASVTDANGGGWIFQAPTVSGTSQVYTTSVLGADPADYWRLGDTGGQAAVNQIKGATATYSGVTLGAGGSSPFTDSTGATFNGTSSYLQLPGTLLPGTGAMSVGLWFNTSQPKAILLGQQASALGGATCPCAPLLWIGPDGTLRGMAPTTAPTGPLTGMAHKCLDLNNYGTSNGTKAQVWDCTGAANQVWQQRLDSNGQTTLLNPVSGRCLDVAAGGTANGTVVRLWDCANNANQVWVPQPDGSWKNPQSARCLDLQGPSSTNGTQAWIWDCYSGAGQMWAASLASAAGVNDGKWHYAALTSDGTTQTLYLDGARQGSSAGPTLTSTPQPYGYVGAGRGTAWQGLSGTADSDFTGTLSDVAFYRSPLSAATVQGQYTASTYSGGLTPVQRVGATDPGGKTITYRYDLTNGARLISRTDGLGNTTSVGYDTGGFVNTTTDPNGVIVTTGHDVRGNTVSRTACQNQAANACSTTYYSYFPDATTTQLSPNAKNHVLLTVRDPRSASATDTTYLTSYSYDAAGNRTAVTTPPVSGYPAGRTVTTAYTDGTSTAAADGGYAPAGLPWKATTAGGAVQTNTYFHNGDLASTTDAAGLVTTYTYDNLGRPTGRKVTSDSYPNGLTTTLSFDQLNRLRVQTDPAVTDRVTGAIHTRQTATVYDTDGNVTSQTVADLTGGDASRTTSATFNSHDQPATSTDPAGNTTSVGYDAYGNRIRITNPAGVETDAAYDADRHLLTTTLKGYTGDPVNPSPAADLVIDSRAYDPAGRLASTTDSMGWVSAYTYTDDGLTATITLADPAHPGTSFVTESNSYDAAGNLIGKVTNNGATSTTRTLDATGRTTSATVDPAGVNRTTSYTYSPDDAPLVTQTSGAGGASTTEATYDPMGRMTSRTVDLNNVTAPDGWWKLNETSGTTAADSGLGQHPGTATGGVTWSGGAASFDGTSAVATSGRVLDTTRSYSVSAWVKLSTTSTGDQTVVSQDAVHNSGFVLQYDSTVNRWLFAQLGSDSPVGWSTFIQSANPPTVGAWTHLVAVYDSGTGSATLYVNGAQAGTGTGTGRYAATGALAIGRDLESDNPRAFLNGQAGNVQVYQRALSTTEVSTLYGNGRSGPSLSTGRLTTTWTLDRRGLPTSVTDPNGNITSYSNDEAGQLAVSTAPTVNTETGGGTPVATHPVSMVGYDTFGATVETSDPDGNTTTSSYDADGRPVAVTLPGYTPPGGTPIGAVTRKTYNNLSQVSTATDPLGHQSSYTYDQFGRIATVTAPNSGVTHYTYDTEGDQLSVTDPNGALTQATYDYLGRKTTTTQVVRQPAPASYTTAYAYNTTGGWLSSVTTPGSVVTSYGYNNVGETTSITDGAANTTTYAYDYAGRKTKTTLPDGTAATATFDAAGRQTAAAKTDTDGTTVLAGTSAGYDNNGNLTSATDARGHATTYTVDATNRLTSEVQPVSATASITTSFGYDAAGNRTRFTDGRGNPFITTYNRWNLPESQIEPSTPAYPNLADRTYTTGYDAAGRIATQAAPGGVTVTNSYDNLNHLTGQTGSGADAPTTARSFGYDTGGRLTTASAPGGTDTFTLDDRSLLLTATGPSGASSFAYNSDGLMTSRTDAAGTSSYTYDTADRLKTITDAVTGTVLTLGYNPLSQPTQITYGAGANVRSFGYDHLHRLISDTLQTSAASTIASISYGYDPNGNETSKTTTGFTGAGSNTYTYDWADRLTSWTTATGSSTYAYDNSGNRTQSGLQTFSYDARNRLTSGAGSTYSYTARGTLAALVTGGSTVTATNDAFGQTITQGSQTQGSQTYTYDALGRVVTDAASGGATRTFTYTGTGNTLAGDGSATYSRDPAGAVIGIKTGTSGVLAWTDQHTDLIGQFTATGNFLTGSTTYGPLGTIVATAGMAGNLGYQSAFTETSSGRVNMAARWYNPATGQFDNRDTASNSPTPNPANANRYAYANDNPLTNIDPDGHRATEQDDNGKTFFVAASTNGGNDVAWGATHLHYRRGGQPHFQQPNRNNYRTPRTGAAPSTHVAAVSAKDLDDSASRRDLNRTLDDVKNRAEELLQDALAKCHSIRCEQAVYDKAAAGAYDWVDRGDGTYAKADGNTLVIFTDDNRVAAVKQQQQAAEAAQAKAAACANSWWCRTKKWATDHAELIGAIAGAVTGILVGAACLAGSWGVGSVGCVALGAMAAGAVNGLVTHGLDVAAGRANGGLMGWLGAATEGAYNGLKSLALTPVDAIHQGATMVNDIRRGDWKGAALAGGSLALDAATIAGVGGAAAADVKSGLAGLRAGTDLGAAVEDEAATANRPTGCRNSFDPATPVLMADRTSKPIKDIKVGDKVTATDPTTDKTTAQPVTQLHLNVDTDLTDVAVAAAPAAAVAGVLATGAGGTHGPTSILHTTTHHPFWDTTARHWVNAGDLTSGHQLGVFGGQAVYVVGVHNHTGAKDMHNLTIATVHTYYVMAGNVPALVHNCGTGGTTPTTPGAHDPVPLYRNVDGAEFDSIATTGKFGTGPGNMEGKWFATQGEHADQWGQALNNGEGLTVQTSIPRWLADQLHYHPGKLDGIGPGMYADADQLGLINEHMSGISLWPS